MLEYGNGTNCETTLSAAARLRAALAQIRSVKSLAGAAMLAALNLVLNQFTVMVSQFLELGFAFLATAMAGYLYGPFLAGLMGVVTDTLGWVLRPNGAYFPFWAINEFLLGFIYGCWFYRRPVRLWRVAAACLTVMMAINLVLTPLWLHLQYGNAFVMTAARLVKNLIKLPIDVGLMYALLKMAQARRKTLLK